ncbi:type II toxin-antitoxin system Phd/YefM family antitoxin [Desulfosarcina ovata]|uniref:type II toxin-antitoxin system Phd/YefM family antitoxin n=1 Tax=Desulfosarcina ovata TaxID=83564 RepID=UPI0012D2ABCB|nr:type II toxin-antitoxin system prevent-host-death family antitoxin [Desulfosarcina ovata]
MIQSNINEIKTHLSSYLEKVAQGETVVICKRNVPIAEIKPIKRISIKKRPVGLALKKYPGFELTDDCLAPLPEDLIDAFYGENE